MVIFRDLTDISALFGLVIHHDPCSIHVDFFSQITSQGELLEPWLYFQESAPKMTSDSQWFHVKLHIFRAANI